VTQDIETSWLLGRARDAKAERRVLSEVASYGRQIGVLSDVVLTLAERARRTGWSREETTEYEKLKGFVARIGEIKTQERDRMVNAMSEADADALVAAIRQRFPRAGSKK
jgi:hypothetical protein